MDSGRNHIYLEIPSTTDNTLPDIANITRTKRRRISQESYEIPWTTSRCNRLLRTITSRISVLQKLAASHRCHNSDDTSGKKPDQVTHSGSFERYDPTLVSPSKDPDWLPEPRKKSCLRTYNKRKSRKTGSKIDSNLGWTPQRGGVGLSTPFIRSMLHVEAQLTPSPSSATANCQQRRIRPGRFALRPGSAAEEAQNNLIQALSSFLLSTGLDDRQKRTGASPLISTCLRRIPSYIYMIEEDTAEEECENGNQSPVTDITAEVYNELETLGTGNNSGWAGLRVVVRAHGIWHLRNAIRNKVLPNRITEALINVCTKHNAFMEAQQLMEAFAERQRSVSIDLCSKIIGLGEGHNSAAFSFRTIGHLLQRQVISGVDLSSQRELWQAVLKSIGRTSGQAEAIDFLTLCITSSSIGSSSRDLNGTNFGATMRGIAILLTCMCIRQRGLEAPPPICGVELDEILHRIATISSIRMLSLKGSVDVFKSIHCPFFLGSLILHIIRSCDSGGMGYMNVERISAAALAVDDVGDLRLTTDMENFISDLALCIGRSDPDEGDRLLFGIVRKLLDFADNHLARAAAVLRSLALKGAMAYSEKRMTRKTISFAEEVEDEIIHPTGLMTQDSLISKSEQREYRWEEGLCEWIAVTPRTEKNEHRNSLDDACDSGVDLSFSNETEVQINTLRSGENPAKRKRKSDEASIQTSKICTSTNFSPDHLLVASVRDNYLLNSTPWTTEIGDTDQDELAFSTKEDCKARSSARTRTVQTLNLAKNLDYRLKMYQYGKRSRPAPKYFDDSSDELGW